MHVFWPQCLGVNDSPSPCVASTRALDVELWQQHALLQFEERTGKLLRLLLTNSDM
jgi:hypothetical protein